MELPTDNPAGTPRYRRLPGLRLVGNFARAALRMADDHLLLCDFRMSFIERYKRFYFRDIEAFVIRKTAVWYGVILVWLAIAGLIYLIASSARWNLYVTLTLEAVCGAFLLRNLIRGPSCRTHIQTAVQTDVLPMLNRVRQTRRVFRQLFPIIQEAQADAAHATAATPANPPPIPAAENIGVPVENSNLPAGQRAPLSLLHLVTFLAVLLSGIAALVNVTTRSYWSFIVVLVLFFAASLAGLCALIFQVKHPVPRAAAASIWILVIVWLMGGISVNTGYCWYDMFLRAGRGTFSDRQFHQLSPFAIRAMPGFDNVLWVFGGLGIVLGLAGLIGVFLPAFVRGRPPPLPKAAIE